MLRITFTLHFMLLVIFKLAAQTIIVPFGSDWKYLDNGTDQTTAWRATSFNDGNWKAGPGKFGYGIGDATTVISYGANAKKKHITTYFRKSIAMDASAYTSYTAKVKRDDGVVVYVNGSEVYRNNMPTGTITYTTTALDAKDNGTVAQSFTIPSSFFASGTNVIAVEIHQQRANTPDMAFDLELAGNTTTPPPVEQYTLAVNVAGSGTVSKNPNQATYASGSKVTLTATPASGYQFAGWGGDASGTDNPLTVTMDGNKAIIATFTATQAQYSLTVSTSGSGTVAKEPNQATYTAGSTVRLTATPASGHQFSGWSGDASGNTNPLTVTMDKNKAITATFTTVSGQPQVTGFTLIAANTDTDIGPITDGQTINLASLSTTKLTIRANTSPAAVGSVRFELNGAQTRDYTDNTTPYSLFGDDGSTNYYFGSWGPPTPGAYILRATPYTLSGGKGTAGTPLAISFTITENGEPPEDQPRVVNLSSPANNSSFELGQPVLIAATVSDSDGTIVKVEFFANNNKVGEDTTTPYSFTWTPPNTGTYSLTAKSTSSGGIATTSASVSINVTPIAQIVTPLFVTEPLLHDADDPAIWINKENPAASLIIGTDKDVEGALYVYNMEGKIIPEKIIRNLQRPNNVDVEYGLALQGRSIDIAVTTERITGKLRVFSLPDMRAVDNGGINVFVGETGIGYNEPMGVSLYKKPSDGKIHAIVSRKSGPTNGTYLWQYVLEDDGQGNIKGTLVRKFGNYSGRYEIEAVAVDDELGYVYYSDERIGVRKYYADPVKGNQELALFATTGFAAAHEGIALYKIEDGTGYIIVADQDAGEMHIYSREGTFTNPHDHQLLKVVKLEFSGTDGIEIANHPIAPNFSNGIFVASSGSKYFHLYRWEDIAGDNLKVQSSQSMFAGMQSNAKAIADETNQLEVYPTLAKRGTDIHIRTSSPGQSEAFVTDMTGRILITLKFIGTTSIETIHLPRGIYFISLSSESQLTKRKFLIND